jgi:hypothetical protein
MKGSLLAAAMVMAALMTGVLTRATDAGRDAPPFVLSATAPNAAPNPPFIAIRAGASSVALDWTHPDLTLTGYETWRGQQPYFDPAMGQGEMLSAYSFSEGIYGDFSTFSYVDNGSCGYFVADGQNLPCVLQNPPVMVIGDASRHYYWMVRATNGEFAESNRVGEFDFSLVTGH